MAAGMLPSMLKKRALVGAVRLYADEIANEFPITQLFGPFQGFDSSTFVLDVIEESRTLGTEWNAKPTTGAPLELEKFSRIVEDALYKSVSWSPEPGELNVIRDVEGMEPALVPDSLRRSYDRKEAYVAKKVAGMIRYLARMYEKLWIELLTTSGGASITLDGATISVGSGYLDSNNFANAGATWATASTDIHEHWATAMTAARHLFGGRYPELVICSEDLWSTYIVPNDNVNDFIVQNPEWVDAGAVGPEYAMPSKLRRYEVVTVGSQYGSLGSTTDMFAADDIVFIKDKRAFMNACVLSDDNDFTPGFHAYSHMKQNPKVPEVVANIHALPVILDPTAVYRLHVTP